MLPLVGLFAVALVEAGLAAAVLVRNPGRAVNRWFSAFAGTMAIWSALGATFELTRNPAVSVILIRSAISASALIPVTFFRFAMVFPTPGAVRPASVQVVTLTGLFIAGLAFSPWLVSAVRLDGGVPRPVYGPLHPLFGFFMFGCFVWALAHLARKRRTTGFARAQLHHLFLGTALAFMGAVSTNLVVPLFVPTARMSYYGPYFTLILVAFAAHAIIRHRLMDIRVAVSRSVAYAAGWALTVGLVLGGGLFLRRVAWPTDPVPPAGGAILLGLVAAAGFVALAPRLGRLADRYVYRPAYDAHALVRDGTRAMATFAGPERVAGAMAGLIGRAFPLESLAILLRHRERDEFQPVVRQHVDPTFAWARDTVTSRSPLVQTLTHRPEPLLADDLLSGRLGPAPEAAAVELHGWAAEVAVPVPGDRGLSALILAGPKRSGDPFFRADLDLLETLARQLAIGLENAQLYREVVSIKEYNERILAHMDSGVVAVREDGTVTTFNPAAARISGLEFGEVLGRSLAALDPALQAILKDSLAGQQDTAREVTVTHSEGHSLPLLVHTSALHDAKGQVRGAIAVFTDHSRLKALEEDKRRTERLAAVGALASGIAHEIRNPLVAIKTFAELLPERADDQEFRSTFAKVAVKEIHRIEELLGRLRALAVPAASALRPLDIRIPIMETLDLLRGEADRRRVRLVTELDDGLPAVVGEPAQLKQLFLNLLLNGLEAMVSEGSLTVTARADRDWHERRLVTVRVADTGPGIPPEELARVFEPFFTTKTHGTGLGLAICRGIADAHRAALWAEAGADGAGTTFVAQFPALVEAPVAESVA